MRITKMIGLVAIAALALTAWAGATSASAAETTLCKTGTISPYCNSGDRYAAETAISAGGEVIIDNPIFITLKCTGSTFSAKTTAASGAPLPVSVSSWSLGKCVDLEGDSCKTGEVKSLPYAGSLARTEESDGSLSLGSGEAGEPRLFVQCGAFMHCEWAMPQVKVDGGASAQLVIPKTTLVKKGGVLCPSTASIELRNFKVSSPSPLWVARAESQPALTVGLCNAAQWPCEQSHLYAKGTSFESKSTNFTINNNTGTGGFGCSEATLVDKTGAASANPLPLESTSLALAGCHVLGASESCTSSTLGQFSGSLGIEGNWKGQGLSVNLQCGPYNGGVPTFNCTYSVVNGVTLQLQSGNPAAIKAKSVPMELIKGSLCGSFIQLNATFTASSPKPIYISDVVPAT